MYKSGEVRTWSEVMQRFEGRCEYLEVKASSMDQYRRVLGWFSEWADSEGINPADIGPEQVSFYLENLRRLDGKSYSRNSKRSHARGIKTLLNFAYERKIIAENIAVAMPKAKDDTVKALTDPEIEKVINFFEERADETARDIAIVRFLLDTGVRAAELCALDWADLSWNEDKQIGKVSITKQLHRDGEMGPTKNGKNRDVYFTRTTWEALKMSQRRDIFFYLDKAGQSYTDQDDKESKGEPQEIALRRFLLDPRDLVALADVEIEKIVEFLESFYDKWPEGVPDWGPVFWSWSAWRKMPNRLTTGGLDWILRNVAGKALKMKLHAHLFRHTNGKILTQKGLSPIVIMQLLGHSDLTMVMRYAQLWGDDVAKVYAEKMNGSS